MIDWLTYSFKIDGNWFIRGDTIMVADSETGEIKCELYKFKQIESETSASIKTGIRQLQYTPAEEYFKEMDYDPEQGFITIQGDQKTYDPSEGYSTIQISGNPSKYFQGHNLWGSNNVRAIIYEYTKNIMQKLFNCSLTPNTRIWGFKITRIYCTRNYMLPSREDVRAWLRAAGAHIQGGHQNVSKYDDETVYVGQRSRRISTKLYCKGAEFDKRLEAGQRSQFEDSNQLPKNIGRSDIYSKNHDLMKSYADGILRIEVCIRSQELKQRDWQDADTWTPSRVETLIDERIKKLGIEELEMNTTPVLDKQQLRLFMMWQGGYDFRKCKKSTFYRYRAIMREVGVSLLAPPTMDKVPVIGYITAEKIATIPEWGTQYHYTIPHTAGLSGIHGPASHWRRGPRQTQLQAT